METIASLYDRTFPRVYRTIRWRVDNEAAAEELTARAYEEAVTSFRNYRPEQGPLDAWLFGIVHHVVGDYLRQRKFFAWFPWETFLRQPASDPLPEEVVTQQDLEAHLVRVLPQLRDRERELLGLKYAAGLTNRRIAELSHLSEQNVGVILYRAIGHLRQLMSGTEINQSTPCLEKEGEE